MFNIQPKSKFTDRKSSWQSENEIFDAKYKAAVKAYHNYMEGFHFMLSENERRMGKILMRRAIPLWFQELSNEQIKTIDQLLTEIRDDLDEDTVHRCQAVIRHLGVYPLCPSTVFRKALIFSRGNDLSFIWFLLELFYSKSETDDMVVDYTNNERLLMSSICHLDMMTTLRGLESVLPPPNQKEEKCSSSCSHHESFDWTSDTRYCSPYLKPLHVSEPRSAEIHKFRPRVAFCIARYERYRDPDFVIPNEASRWFAKQTRSNQTSFDSVEKTKRSVPLTSACDSAEVIVKELLNDQIALMVGREVDRRELCRKHQDMEKRRQKLMNLLTKRTKVREQLTDGAARIRAERKHAEQIIRENRMIQLLLRRIVDHAIISCMLTPRSNCPECWASYERQRRLLAGTKCSCEGERGVFCMRSMLEVNQSTAQKYFKCGCGGVPYQFDYKKILEDDSMRPVCPVKKAIRVALGMEEDDLDEGQAIARCMKEMWRCELKLWNDKFLKGREDVRNKATGIDMLDYEFVDSKDPVCLQNLLKRALLKLCEDSKYVLATFPDAYKIPFLNSWIQNYYGARVTQKTKDDTLQESKYFWDWLIPKATAMRWPVCKDLGMQGRVNWNYKKRLENKAQQELAKFYRKFKRIQMQEARLYWSTMDPYHTNVDRFRQVFFDYLPNCEPLIGPMIRPWHPFEYRPVSNVLKGSDSKTQC
ncbi:uncharacterized protein LOC129764326 [Toxorhynchites rutilus septentrionalis]|uniref:uncharacterized protein LOC129764326 n=1 Tax=Toxorhynchites rutilus septentrionalis TaxID=329112 RepID=UPI002478366A|nr:uncharacterized protein LOC129764326 [Toxorhynchites rutilus septentrionalis]